MYPFISFNVGQVQPAGHGMSHKNQMWTPGGRTKLVLEDFLIFIDLDMIICGYAGIGKSYLAHNYPGIIDSVLFMIGYADFGELDSVGITVLAILALLIFAPILFPMNLGCAIHEIRN